MKQLTNVNKFEYFGTEMLKLFLILIAIVKNKILFIFIFMQYFKTRLQDILEMDVLCWFLDSFSNKMEDY